MPRVPVSSFDKKKSYYKYFLRPMAEPPAGRLEAIPETPGDVKDALHINDRNRLFEPGDLPGPFGWWRFGDGTIVIANKVMFPGTTGEMFDWWFTWHPIDRLRYAIWDPEDHFGVFLEDKAKALDMSLSVRERHWGSTHYIWEDIGSGSVELILAQFMRPADQGYDESRLDTDACSALICANGFCYGTADTPDMPVVMSHFLRPAEGGSELRSHFWFGWQFEDGEPKKCIPDGMALPDEMAIGALRHNVIEYTNLAAILPEVYAEEKDNWAD
ncbi:MAG: phloretin hydrolase [Clostridiales bacterium]|nr:phloretin hydrolase [Clostridiales bacterium]